MIAQEFINPLIPPLKPNDTAQKALNWMSQFRVHQLPVVHNGTYLGLVSEELLYDTNKPQARISEFELQHTNVHISENQHFYDVIKIADKNNMPVIPVVDEALHFKGIITVKDTFTALARTFATQNPGGIVVLSMKEYDYSMAQLSRLIEADGAKILSSYIESDPYDPTMLKVTLKLNKIDLSHIIATFERFNFNVIAKFQEIETVDYDKERLDMFFKYLNL
jgi:CBS domain-containing protein